MAVKLSSLPLQVLFYLNVWYSIVFVIGEILLYVFKGIVLPFPNMAGTLAMEVIMIILLGIIDSVRLFLGFKGNLAERKLHLIISIVLAIPVLFIQLFLMLWQTYVLRIEMIICSIVLVFLGLELLLSIATVWTFKKHEAFIQQ